MKRWMVVMGVLAMLGAAVAWQARAASGTSYSAVREAADESGKVALQPGPEAGAVDSDLLEPDLISALIDPGPDMESDDGRFRRPGR